MASSALSPINTAMNNGHLFFVVKHSFGCGTVAGIYTTQVCHIYEVIGISPISMGYIVALLAFYFILYGYEAKFISFVQDSYRQQLKNSKSVVMVLNALLTVVECLGQSVGHHGNTALLIFNGGILLICTLFTEWVLTLLFAIESPGRR